MKLLTTLAACAALAVSAPVAAQDAPIAVTPQVPAPADPASVTDVEIAGFVDIVLQGQALEQQGDLSEDELAGQMMAVIGASELGMDRFMAVAQAISADEALQQRVQTEVVARLDVDGAAAGQSAE
ncbi:hypothetical protein GRI62_08880 [Erythrobacter arachoides]|uniref:DUF4168 domain-containing protein n=1 Tax=Aurantiacibacter arachoides TaxID=1850444 RepID=A0A845A849_9SPHN|nr:hypothetical protein [Aurantiacibacter arachoides]MXO93719.1 hypothetical protein [Aurantiacibacter arachoides]GGD47161.1 hypothetical protein GCM10011411_03630 [Aurantiacibacter arachoides]